MIDQIQRWSSLAGLSATVADAGPPFRVRLSLEDIRPPMDISEAMARQIAFGKGRRVEQGRPAIALQGEPAGVKAAQRGADHGHALGGPVGGALQ